MSAHSGTPFEPVELPAVEGDVRIDEGALARAAVDWGQLVRARPRAVVRPASTADVAAVIRFASSRGIPLAARGAGHSPFGQALASGGIVLDMSGMRAVRPLGSEQVGADAGACWEDVVRVTLPEGVGPPVLPDYLGLTVGGTLSVGGIGGSSQHYGAQTDTVAELEVVTGTGEVVTCSGTVRRDLFDVARGGLGQYGVITRAVLRLLPAVAWTRRWRVDCGGLTRLLELQRALLAAGRVNHLQGQITREADAGRGRYILEAAIHYRLGEDPVLPDALAAAAVGGIETEDSPRLTFLERMRDDEAILRADGGWYQSHPWLNLFLPDGAVETFVARTLQRTSATNLGLWGLVLLYPLRADRLATPLLRLPPGPIIWLCAVLRTSPPDDPQHGRRMVQLNGHFYRDAARIGGTAYPTNAMPLTADDWRTHFGPLWDWIKTAKQRFDPAHILAPGQAIISHSPR